MPPRCPRGRTSRRAARPFPRSDVSCRAMSSPSPQKAPRAHTPRTRSAFAAAFLSLIFPGLGHAYAGAWARALAFAALPLLLIALAGGIFISKFLFLLLLLLLLLFLFRGRF